MIDQAIRTIRTLLPQNTPSFSIQEIEAAVDQALSIPIYNELERNHIIRRVEEIYNVRQDTFRIIEDNERRRPWLNDTRETINFQDGFWGYYKNFLLDDRSFPPDTVLKLDRLTDKILDNLFNPREQIQISKRGLVVGHVQSGKTANYTGLICKAADAGYNLIIILAGIHNNLRAQTQLRLDESFLGFDTQHLRAVDQGRIQIGVGNDANNRNIAHSLTSSLNNGDFTQAAFDAQALNFQTTEPIVAVIKKNPHVLRRIHTWLSAQATINNGDGRIIRNKSLLLIDDEADNASINTNRPEWQPTRINGQIRDILNLFTKNAYVGYTATPFANIFVRPNEDDLFPRDFIVNIPAPSNYVGPNKVFGFELADDETGYDNTLPIVNRIEDYHHFVPNRHRKDDELPFELPESLKRALRCFILTCAIRRLRGQTTSHNSMLVHVSRFTRWQDQICHLVEGVFENYKIGIDQNDPSTLGLFRQTFEVDQDDYKSFTTTSETILNSSMSDLDTQIQVHTWEEVLQHLNNAVLRIQVRAIHGTSGEALNYYDNPNGLSVIAVGGNKLSRGLTLEGLSVSYYLRASRMYDTLMQMGRWFGYRAGYVDLCRLFTSRELNEWFCHITEASEELREEFDYMSDNVGATPEQYALSVRTHPGVLQISASNKLRSAVNVQISWSGRLVESYEFKKDTRSMETNFIAYERFANSLPSPEIQKPNAFVWYNIPPESILEFLQHYQSVENLKRADPRKLIQFIQKKLSQNECINWRVALMSKNDSRASLINIDGHTTEIGQWTRTEDERSSDEQIYYLRKSHIISPKDEFIDFTEEEYSEAMRITNEQRENGVAQYPKGQLVRDIMRNPQEPLLILYLLNPEESLTRYPLESNDIPFVGYAISFPSSEQDSNVPYAVNDELLAEFQNQGESDDFENEEYED